MSNQEQAVAEKEMKDIDDAIVAGNDSELDDLLAQAQEALDLREAEEATAADEEENDALSEALDEEVEGQAPTEDAETMEVVDAEEVETVEGELVEEPAERSSLLLQAQSDEEHDLEADAEAHIAMMMDTEQVVADVIENTDTEDLDEEEKEALTQSVIAAVPQQLNQTQPVPAPAMPMEQPVYEGGSHDVLGLGRALEAMVGALSFKKMSPEQQQAKMLAKSLKHRQKLDGLIDQAEQIGLGLSHTRTGEVAREIFDLGGDSKSVRNVFETDEDAKTMWNELKDTMAQIEKQAISYQTLSLQSGAVAEDVAEEVISSVNNLHEKLDDSLKGMTDESGKKLMDYVDDFQDRVLKFVERVKQAIQRVIQVISPNSSEVPAM